MVQRTQNPLHGVTMPGNHHVVCSYATLPDCVAQAAADNKMFLIFDDGYINVCDAKNEIGRVHTCLAEAEKRLTGLSQISEDLIIDSGAGFLVKRAGWNWRRYLNRLNIYDTPKYHPELPMFLANHAWAMKYWVAGIQDLPTIRELW